MIILHGAFLEEKLFLWSEAPAPTRPKKQDGARKGRAPRSHPLDAGFDAVSKAVRGIRGSI